jgi:hypothetical protein
MQRITQPHELEAFRREHGLRHDWHENDEHDVTARVVARIEGTPLDFDNAGHWPDADVLDWPAALREKGWTKQVELHVIFCELIEEDGRAVRGRDLACVNLADLCAWASTLSRPCDHR